MDTHKLRPIRNTAMAMLAIGIIVQPLKLSYTGAYFTDKARPGENKNEYGMAKTYGLNSYSGPMKLSFDVHKFPGLNVQMHIYGSELRANVNIPSGYGFDARNITIDSAEITYNGISSGYAPIGITGNGNQLHLVFDLGWEWASGFDHNEVNLYFNIEGKGLGSGTSGLGERFIFDASGELAPASPAPPSDPGQAIIPGVDTRPGAEITPEPKPEITPEEEEKEEEIDADTDVGDESETRPEDGQDSESTPEPEPDTDAESRPVVLPEAMPEPEVEPTPEPTPEPEQENTEEAE